LKHKTQPLSGINTNTMASTEETNKGPKGAVGLRNLGNSCYANAAIQALRQVTEMTYLCLADKSDLQKKHANHSGNLFEAYKDLIKTMWSACHPSYVSPDAFRREMLIAANESGYDQFLGREQQDAHEFMMFLLDQIFEGTKEEVSFIIQRPPPKNPTEQRILSALEAWKTQFEKQYTPIVDIWFGLLEYETECQACKNKSYRYETFNTLKISMPHHIEAGKAPPTLQEMLQAEWEPETIEGYACDKCSPTRTTAKRAVKIWRMPRCLVVMLKRFMPDGRKLNTPWTPPEATLSLRQFFSEASPERSKEYEYGIQAIVDHHGSSRGGHYVAQGLSPLDGKWYLYDDESTHLIEKPNLGQSSYVLLFRAQN
jgi:ubiquitin C-terminal hydrolase